MTPIPAVPAVLTQAPIPATKGKIFTQNLRKRCMNPTLTLKHWEGLTHFVSDKRIPLTNNIAERTIRHSVVGRKNFYGSRSINGANVAATFYTIIESCKRVELNARDYILKAVEENLAGRTVPTPLQYATQIRS